MLKKLFISNIVLIFFAIIFFGPLQLSYADYNSFTVNIPNSQGGYTALDIRKSGDGYVGPNGEYYASFPSVAQLQSVYGLVTPASSADVLRERMIEQQADEQVKANQERMIIQQQMLNKQMQKNIQKQEAQEYAQREAAQKAELQPIQQQAQFKNNFWEHIKDNLIWTIFGLLIFTFYFFPSIVAGTRKHLNFTPILLLNLFLGFTGIGWIVALVWSFSHQESKKDK